MELRFLVITPLLHVNFGVVGDDTCLQDRYRQS
jgi:hypothetical protein